MKYVYVLVIACVFVFCTACPGRAIANPWSNKTVLHIGDSQVAGPYGRELGRLLLISCRVQRYHQHGASGKGVLYWLARNRALRLARRASPDIILVTMGGNDALRSYRDYYPEKIRELDDLLSEQTTSIWVSPPVALGRSSDIQVHRDHVTEIISNNVRNFLDVRDITASIGSRSPDGIHFTRVGGGVWAARTLGRLTEKLQSLEE